MPTTASILALRADTGTPVLARFAVLDQECVVVPMGAAAAPGRSLLGNLVLEGRHYAVLCSPRPPPAPDPSDRLTPRELEIALLIAGGCCNKSIARRLGISSHTVGAHIGRIFAKLAVHKRTELAACVARRLQIEQ
jgi:DNA-binding NarL/FixJ family response regulator